jgi:uncharacterized protein YgbK (DUF1537 family)
VLSESPIDADAIVVSLKSRSIPASQAICRSVDALKFLQSQGIQQFFFKYCSTFDSTPAGNIGPVADALAEQLEARDVMFCPAFPENGRTVYCGHLFVAGVPLHESSMRHHPLNPMTDSNLVRVLQAQSQRHVALWPRGEKPVAADGQHWIADAIDDNDLKRIAHQASEHRLLTGGSAIARYWAEELLAKSNRKVVVDNDAKSKRKSTLAQPTGRSAILAGSCSDATRSQIAEFAKRYPLYQLDLTQDAVEDSAGLALAWVNEKWASSRSDSPSSPTTPLLICSSVDATAVAQARQRWGESHAAVRVEQIFALIAKGMIDRDVRRLIVAGGETSGSVLDALQVKSVRIEHEIAPGVPWVQTTGTPALSLALKSGNFGKNSFFIDALENAP